MAHHVAVRLDLPGFPMLANVFAESIQYSLMETVTTVPLTTIQLLQATVL
jgi:hypothetical protein